MGYGGSVADSGKAVGKSGDQQLTDLLFEFNVGVSKEQTFTIKRIDLDYFEEM